MPVRFVRLDGPRGRVLVVRDPFWIGSAPEADLVIDDPRIAERHARLRYKQGEHVLSAADGASIWVNGEALPLMPLRDGDRVALSAPDQPEPIEFAFESDMEDSYVPPGMTVASAWLAHPRSTADAGPDGYGDGDLIDDRPTDRIRRVLTDDDDLVVKILGPVRDGADADRHLALLSRLAGATHHGVAPVVDGGLFKRDGQVLRWMATRYVPGRISRVLIGRSGLDALAVIELLASVAFGLKHLHGRGLVHRDVSPSNVIVGPGRKGTLIDFGQTVVWEEYVPSSLGVIGTPGYVAPEEVLDGARVTPAVDIYGACALGYALATGRAPVGGGDLLETLGNATAPVAAPAQLGFELPAPLEEALMAGLCSDPGARPSAGELARACERARAVLEPDELVDEEEPA